MGDDDTSRDVTKTMVLDALELNELQGAVKETYWQDLIDEMRQELVRAKVEIRHLRTRLEIAQVALQARENLTVENTILWEVILDSLPCGVEVWQGGGTLYWRNKRAEELTGKHTGEIVVGLADVASLGATTQHGAPLSAPVKYALRGTAAKDILMKFDDQLVYVSAYPVRVSEDGSPFAVVILEEARVDY